MNPVHFTALDGLISNLFTTIPAVVVIGGVWYLARRGFFGPGSQ